MGDGCARFRSSLDLLKSETGFRLGSIISDAFADHRELAGPGQGDFSPIDMIAYQLTARITSCLLKITGPNLFAPYFSVSSLIIKQFGR
jgi:hypothetical protein